MAGGVPSGQIGTHRPKHLQPVLHALWLAIWPVIRLSGHLPRQHQGRSLGMHGSQVHRLQANLHTIRQARQTKVPTAIDRQLTILCTQGRSLQLQLPRLHQALQGRGMQASGKVALAVNCRIGNRAAVHSPGMPLRRSARACKVLPWVSQSTAPVSAECGSVSSKAARSNCCAFTCKLGSTHGAHSRNRAVPCSDWACLLSPR